MNLTSWTIYQENNGYITLQIRYNEKPGASSRDGDGHYRRKSPRQVNRDRERRRQWQSARHTEGFSQTNAEPRINANHDRGSTQTVVIEQTRDATNFVSDKMLEADVSTPSVTVMSPIVTISKTLALTVHDTPETGRHDGDNDTIPILLEISDISLQEDQSPESSLCADILSPVSKCSMNECNAPAVRHSPTLPDDDDAVGTPDDPVPDLSTSASLTDNDETVDDEPPTPWEPPPGFCWICWTDYPGLVCSKHPK